MSVRPIRFGVIVETHTDQSQWFALARRAEELGYSTFLIRDHIAPDYFGPQFSPLVALASLAGVTSTLRLGTLVIDNDFRHPAMLAKEAATLDVLTDGRVELGIGAGWLRIEYDRAGLQYDPNGIRIDRLEESLQVLRDCFRDGSSSFTGDHYQFDRHHHFPMPHQKGGPPILIGAGRPRMLRLAGKYADIVGLLTVSVSTGEVVEDTAGRRVAAVRKQIDLIREGAGDRFDQIEISCVATVQPAKDSATGFTRIISDQNWTGVSVADASDMAAVFAGSTDEISAQMLARRDDLGISYFIIGDNQMEELAPVVSRISGL